MASDYWIVSLKKKQSSAKDIESEACRTLPLLLTFDIHFTSRLQIQPSLTCINDKIFFIQWLTGFLLNFRMLNELCLTLFSVSLLGCYPLNLCLCCPWLFQHLCLQIAPCAGRPQDCPRFMELRKGSCGYSLS